MNKDKLLILLFWVIFLLSSGKLHAQIVVVVNSKNPVESLSLIKLKRIYMGEVTMWEFNKGEREDIVLLDHRYKTKVAGQFYKKVGSLSQSKIRLIWMGKMLNGEFRSLPVKLDSDADILKYISKSAGAIGFVGADHFDPTISSIKAVEIEGKDFKSEAYSIR